MKRGVVVVDGSVPTAQRDAVTQLFVAEKIDYWHWMTTAWLFIDPENRDQHWWRDKVKRLVDDGIFLIINGDDGDLAGVVSKKGHPWIVEKWRAVARAASPSGKKGG